MQPAPLAELAFEGAELYAKLEYRNVVGSIKDRPAMHILYRAIERGDVDESRVIVESSSGNFARALANYCALVGLSFIPVIDPLILPSYDWELRRMCSRVVRVVTPDEHGSYLPARLDAVQRLLHELGPDAYWPNQYANLDGMEAHYRYTVEDVCRRFDRLDYAFVPVSTAGTLAGVSRRLKERFPEVQIVAVDAEGSAIFGGPPGPRRIPGFGSAIAPPLLRFALVDRVAVVSEAEAISGCRLLCERHDIVAGGSSGAVYAAALRTIERRSSQRPRALLFCADSGQPYGQTIYEQACATPRGAEERGA